MIDGVCEGDSEGVTLADSDTDEVADGEIIDAAVPLAVSADASVVDGVADTVLERLRVVDPLSLPDGVCVIDSESDPVFEELAAAVIDEEGDTSAERLGDAVGVCEAVPLTVADADGVPLPLTPNETVDVVEDVALGVMDGDEVWVCGSVPLCEGVGDSERLALGVTVLVCETVVLGVSDAVGVVVDDVEVLSVAVPLSVPLAVGVTLGLALGVALSDGGHTNARRELPLWSAKAIKTDAPEAGAVARAI